MFLSTEFKVFYSKMQSTTKNDGHFLVNAEFFVHFSCFGFILLHESNANVYILELVLNIVL